MRTFAAVAITGVVVLAGTLYFATHSEYVARHLGGGGGKDKVKRDAIVLSIKYDQATQLCEMKEKAPAAMHVSPSDEVAWVVLGSCPAGHKIAIDHNFKDANGATVDVLNPGGTLEGDAVRLTVLSATMKSDTAKGNYTYTILIDGKPAQYASLADEGDMYVCPVWPCT